MLRKFGRLLNALPILHRRSAPILVFILAWVVIGFGSSLAPAPAAATVAPPATAPVTSPAAAPAVADTGPFAPVAAQQAARLAAIEHLRGEAPSAALVNLLLASGRVDEAAGLLGTLEGDAREVALARAKVHLARMDFSAARPLLEAIGSRVRPGDRERQIYLDWLFIQDDAARVDRLTRKLATGNARVPGKEAGVPDLLAAGRLAYDLLNYARSEACFTRVLEILAGAPTGRPDDAGFARRAQVEALVGLGKIAYKLRDYDGSLERYRQAIVLEATPDVLRWLGETLIRLGRTDEAISASEWAVRLNPYHEMGHYYLGNGYARKNYTQLASAYPGAFADAGGRGEIARADSLLAAGDRAGARAAYESLHAAHPGWADAGVRLASLDFEDGRFEQARDLCFAALAQCPEYGRAHATLAKSLESQRFAVDAHRPAYERRFAAAKMPVVPGIEKFVANWRSLSPRHQKRVALSVAPWKQFIPVLVDGGATYYIKPLYMLLSETPNQETLRDQRINYDSRLWDDVRGAGGYHTVSGVEDVERTIFDKYNTVLHELTHQVHAILTADQGREIQDLYVRAKARDDSTKNGYLSRYAGGSVFEYFAEGANALKSPKRDAYDPREEVRERLDAIDPDLRKEVEKFMALTDVSASYPVAYTNAGDDQVERGRVDEAVTWFTRALGKNPGEETALRSMVNALTLGNRDLEAIAASERAMKAHAASGAVAAVSGMALWHGGRGLAGAIDMLEKARPAVRASDRYEVDLVLAHLYWVHGDADRSLKAADTVIAYQSDLPEGLWSRAAALALSKRWDDAFATYERAVRLRTGVVDLRCDFARDLLRAGRIDAARAQLAEAKLLDEENPSAEALRGWADLVGGDMKTARAHVTQALAWGPWCDLARILLGAVEQAAGAPEAARAAWSAVGERIDKDLPPEYVFRPKIATWQAVHELPAVERDLLAGFEKR